MAKKFLCWSRSHQTKVEFALSDTAVLRVLSGVIQGSGIGPLMFLTHINELITILEEFGVKGNCLLMI